MSEALTEEFHSDSDVSGPDPDYIGNCDLNSDQLLESNETLKMAEKLVTPTFCSGINVYETFKKELDVWKKITKIPKKEQALHVLLNLPGKEKDPLGIKEKILEQDLELLSQEDGLEQLKTYMDKYLAKDEISYAWNFFQDFEDCFRTEDETYVQYINKFDSLYQRLKTRGMVLPEMILAFKLIWLI